MRNHAGKLGKSLAFGLGITLWSSVSAEIVTDGSLGPARGLSGPDYTVGAELGQQAGMNLFHSFARFGLKQGESVTFTGPLGLRNVISRVTGGEVSEINGLLRSEIAGADFYLLNPAGILFGPEARLDLPASFYAGSADSLRLGEDGEFSVNPEAPSVLNSAPPSAFGFLEPRPAPVALKQATLEVDEGRILSLHGGGLSLEDSSLVSPGGRLELVSVAGGGEILPGPLRVTVNAPPGPLNLDNTSLNAVGDTGGAIHLHAGDIVMRRSAARADTRGTGDGKGIEVGAQNLLATEGSHFTVSAWDRGQGGRILINVAHGAEFSGSYQATSPEGETLTLPAGVYAVTAGQNPDAGDAGGILLNAGSLVLKDGAGIRADTLGTGRGGKISLNIEGALIGQGNAVISNNSQGRMADAGQGGGLQIEAGSVDFTDGANISVSTLGPGDSGGAILQINGPVKFEGMSERGERSGLFSQSFGDMAEAGDAGRLLVSAESLEVLAGASLSVNTHGGGQAGDLVLNINGPMRVGGQSRREMGSTLSASTFHPEHGGDGGRILIQARELKVSDGGWIITVSNGNGQAGQLGIQVEQGMEMDGDHSRGLGSAIASDARSEQANAGNAGHIFIQARTLYLRNGALISVATRGPGTGGDLDLEIAEGIVLQGNNTQGMSSFLRLESAGEMPGAGQAGNLRVRADSLSLSDGAEIAADSWGPGDSGAIDIDLQGDFEFSGASEQGKPGFLVANAFGEGQNAGDAGQISIKARNIRVTEQAGISTNTLGPGAGGDIQLHAEQDIELREGASVSSLTAGEQANAGAAGKITLRAANLYLDGGASLTADTLGAGRGGGIFIQTGEGVQVSGADLQGRSSHVFANTRQDGQGGRIEIETARLELSDEGYVGAGARGRGDGGAILIRADSVILRDGGTLFSDTHAETADGGDAGDILLEADSLEARGGDILANTWGGGHGGRIGLTVAGPLIAGQSLIACNANGEIPESGDGGRLDIHAASLALRDTRISTNTSGPGKAGTTQIEVGGDAELVNSSVTSVAFEGSRGDAGTVGLAVGGDLRLEQDSRIGADTFGNGRGGDVEIGARDLAMRSNSVISAGSRGLGDAGTLRLRAARHVTLREAVIETESGGAQGGNISLETPGYLYLENARISTSVHDAEGRRAGNGGDIHLAPEFIIMDHGEIIARAVAGDGGDISIQSTGIYRYSPSPIDAISVAGEDGTVRIDAPDINIMEALHVPGADFLGQVELRRNACATRRSEETSRLTVRHYTGGLNQTEDWQPSP